MGDDKFRSRKFLLTSAVLIVSALALFMGKMAGGEFSTVASVCVGSYSFGNAAEYFAKAKANA